MICQIEESVEPSAVNVVGVVRSVGQSIQFRLPDSLVVEITVDMVQGDQVGLVVATSKPYGIKEMREKR